MKRYLFLVTLIIGLVLVFAGCGGEKGETQKSETMQQSPAAGSREDSEGAVVAKEILGTFDKAVNEAAALVKDKPEAAEVTPKLEELYKKYEEQMKALNVKYLALKTKDIALFGDANWYLGENRGKHVFEKDKILGEIAYYYDQKGETDVARLISKDLVKLLDIAEKR